MLRDEVDKSNAGPDCRWFYALFSAVMLAQYVMVHVRGHCNYVLHKHENRWQGKKVSKLRTKRRVGSIVAQGTVISLEKEDNGDLQAAKCKAPFLEKQAGRWHF